ncbi:MAG: acyl-CoA dehydrogenase family protein [Chloroflexi bacterium]|nr:acyl-CoA dehydrogenase family protein [Chloroflexota bacterium]
MDFEFSEDQKMLQMMVRDFAAKELEPVAAQIDAEARFPAENIKKAAALGLFGIGFPEEYGGSGGGAMEKVIVNEELSRVCASTSIIINGSMGLAGYPLYKYGNEEQRRRFVVPIAKGEKLACFALTESGAGSDIAALETTATQHKNGYILNGTKIFISEGSEAEIILVFATIDKSLRHRGITGFIVERGTPGFSVGRIENKMGIRASPTAELIFEDCFVPAKNRLGNEGQGFRIALDAIDACRTDVAAIAVGIAQGAFDKALAYAQERKQFGQPIANFQAIQWMLADMATQIEAARLLTYRAAYHQDKGLPFLKESCMAKLFAAEAAMFVTSKAIQIHGGYGYMKEYHIERYFRDARILGIFEGTDEMQRLTIARQLLRGS